MGFITAWFTTTARPEVVVVGNEKGGSGKSTTAIHVLIGLLQRGYDAAAIDLDGRQATLSHFLNNRRRLARDGGPQLALPEHIQLRPAPEPVAAEAEREELAALSAALERFLAKDFLVIDTPGSSSVLASAGHLLADTLITPLNDSLLDLDVLVRLDGEGRRIIGPSAYSEVVMHQAAERDRVGGKPVNWIVMRNRVAHLDSHNTRQVGALLEQLAGRLGFRLVPGFGERVIYRELFARGLTLFDLAAPAKWRAEARSQAAARAEVEQLLDAIGPPGAAVARTPRRVRHLTAARR